MTISLKQVDVITGQNYMDSMVTTHTHTHTYTQNSTVDTPKYIKRSKNKPLKVIIKPQGKKLKKERTENKYRNEHKTSYKMKLSTCISIIPLNVNGINAPIERHRVVNWVKKQDPSIHFLQDTLFKSKDTQRLKVRG